MFVMEESQELTEMFLSRAISLIKMGGMEKHMSSIVMCRCVKHIEGRFRSYWLINCIARVQCGLLLTPEEKHQILYFISRRIVSANYFVKEKCRDFLAVKEKQGFIMSEGGLMVKDHVSLKLALKTMSFVVSHTNVPSNVTFSRCPSLMIKPSKWMVMECVVVPTANRSSIVTQPILFRHDLKNLCPEECWPILQKGVCYTPAVRENSLNSKEVWVFHLHTGYFDESQCNCRVMCESCSKYKPISLFQTCQLAVIKYLFFKRRARVLNKRSSPFF